MYLTVQQTIYLNFIWTFFFTKNGKVVLVYTKYILWQCSKGHLTLQLFMKPCKILLYCCWWLCCFSKNWIWRSFDFHTDILLNWTWWFHFSFISYPLNLKFKSVFLICLFADWLIFYINFFNIFFNSYCMFLVQYITFSLFWYFCSYFLRLRARNNETKISEQGKYISYCTLSHAITITYFYNLIIQHPFLSCDISQIIISRGVKELIKTFSFRIKTKTCVKNRKLLPSAREKHPCKKRI